MTYNHRKASVRVICLVVAITGLVIVAAHVAMVGLPLETWHKIVTALMVTLLTVTLVYEPRTVGEYNGYDFSDTEDEVQDREKLAQLAQIDFDQYAAESLDAARTAFALAMHSALDQGESKYEAIHTALAHAVSDFAESMCVQMDTLVTGSAMTDEPIDAIGQAVFDAYDRYPY